ncbi:MAG: hypothetical protein Q8R24_04315 [Legionellaceae bacterium]|nr:hypothetical protein [Legionellaceae bacterium]
MGKLIFYIDHSGGPSSIKILNRRLAQMGWSTDLAIYIGCSGAHYASTFTISMLSTGHDTDEQQTLRGLLPRPDSVLTLKNILRLIRQAKALPFIDLNETTVFIDGNSGSPNLAHVTKLFDTLVHAVGEREFLFNHLFTRRSTPIAPLKLYPFSQVRECCDESNQYIRGERTPYYRISQSCFFTGGFKPRIPLEGFSAVKTELANGILLREAAGKLSGHVLTNEAKDVQVQGTEQVRPTRIILVKPTRTHQFFNGSSSPSKINPDADQRNDAVGANCDRVKDFLEEDDRGIDKKDETEGAKGTSQKDTNASPGSVNTSASNVALLSSIHRGKRLRRFGSNHESNSDEKNVGPVRKNNEFRI